MENRAHALLAAVFILMLGSAIGLSAWWLTGERLAMTAYRVVTESDIGGLNVESTVRYKGMRAGKVTAIHLDPENPKFIHVMVELRTDLPMLSGTEAEIGYQGVTGLAFVSILPGDGKGAPLARDTDGLLRIPMQANVLDQLMSRGQEVVGRLMTLLDNANRLLGDANQTHLASTLANLEKASAGMPQTLAKLDRLLSDGNQQRLSRALRHLEAGSERFPAVMARVDGLLSEQNMKRMERLLVEAEQGGALLPQTLQEVSETLRSLRKLADAWRTDPQAVIFGPSGAPGPGEKQ